ncbi:MAG: hypothetical protein N3D11_16780 [Candidatus Sumerlaeia bacterium]|nr:hypothetical protein [Candidatus Sumerlaeia bacterium]
MTVDIRGLLGTGFVILFACTVPRAEVNRSLATTISDLSAKMESVSSIYYEYTACTRRAGRDKRTTASDAGETESLSFGKVWYEKPLRIRAEVLLKAPNNREMPESRQLEISDGRIMRTVSYYLTSQKPPVSVYCYDLDRVREAKLNPAALMKKPQLILPPIEREYRNDPVGWQVFSQETVGNWPCIHIRREKKMPAHTGPKAVEITDYFFREADGICVRRLIAWDSWRHEWTATRVLVNCSIASDICTFSPACLNAAYQEQDRTHVLIKDLQAVEGQ